MATKTKSRVNKSNKNAFQFKWWMALVLVVVVGGVGLVILRFSQAGSVTKVYADTMVTGRNDPGGCPSYNNQAGSALLTNSGRWCLFGTFQSSLTRFRRLNDNQCAFMRLGSNQAKGDYLRGGAMPIGQGAWVTVSETTSCNI